MSEPQTAPLTLRLHTVVAEIRSRLRSANLKETAALTGVSLGAIRKLRDGDSNPNLQTLELVAYLFDQREHPKPVLEQVAAYVAENKPVKPDRPPRIVQEKAPWEV